jgi:hypothetical protein
VNVLLTAGALVIALAGCSSAIDIAVEKCAQSFADTLAQTQDGGLTAEEKEFALQDGREMCQTFADDDSEGFLQEWG